MNKHREAEALLEHLELLQDLALHDHVEGRRRLVHHDQLGLERKRHCDHDALPHAARELMRIRAHASAVDAHELEQIARAGERVRLADAAIVGLEHVDELVAHPHDRVEHVHRALEDERDVTPAHAPQLLTAHGDEILPLEEDAPTRDLRRRLQDLQHGARERALATARSPARPRISPGAIASETLSTARTRRSPIT